MLARPYDISWPLHPNQIQKVLERLSIRTTTSGWRSEMVSGPMYGRSSSNALVLTQLQNSTAPPMVLVVSGTTAQTHSRLVPLVVVEQSLNCYTADHLSL